MSRVRRSTGYGRLPLAACLLVILAAFVPIVSAEPPDTTLADAAFHDNASHDAEHAAAHCVQTLSRARRVGGAWSSSAPVGVEAIPDERSIRLVWLTSRHTRAPPVNGRAIRPLSPTALFPCSPRRVLRAAFPRGPHPVTEHTGRTMAPS